MAKNYYKVVRPGELRRKQPYVPQERRAVTSAKIATVKNGTRVVKHYNAGNRWKAGYNEKKHSHYGAA